MGRNGAGASLAGLRLLSRDDIFGVADLPHETVDVPEWDGAVVVQGMDVNRRIAFAEYIWTLTVDPATGQRRTEAIPGRSVDAAYAALCIVNEQGEPQFTLADVEALGTKSPAALERVAAVARRLSFPEREVLGENLKAPSGDSPSDSPDTSE